MTIPSPNEARSLRIGFLHPELGIGGAERLVVDAALELQRRGHRVSVITCAHDSSRAFPETSDGTLDVQVYGRRLPHQIFGRLRAPCAVARLSWAAAKMCARDRFDVVFTDLVPYVLPMLRTFIAPHCKLIFYCHYPDQLLARQRRGWYRFYRAALDRLELPAMRSADRILVNSRFTHGVLAALTKRAILPTSRTRSTTRLWDASHAGDAIAPDAVAVVYPGVDVEAYARLPPPALVGDAMFLMVSRFDRRKNLALAIAALARMRELAPELYPAVRLVIAGGADLTRRETVTLREELVQQARDLGVADHLQLIVSPSDQQRLELLGRCLAVVHTARDEHFGIVPIEAMAAARPVLACDAAGPAETVLDGKTGLLRPATADAFAGGMIALASDRARAAAMGQAGRVHVARAFSRRAFGDAIEAQVHGLVPTLEAGS